jgi:hypothetical protein
MPFDTASLDAACTALAAYEWGGDTAALAPIDAAVVAAHGDTAVRAEIEPRLAAVVATSASRAARDYACRKLMLIGTAASVPALAARLVDADDSHMARFALERMPCPEAAAALVAALGVTRGDVAIGIVSSLAAKGDAACVPALGGLLAGEPRLAAAAATALGAIHTPAARAALAAADPFAGGGVGPAVVDARLAAAEALLAAGNRPAALAEYTALAAAAKGRPGAKLVELAATRGILACLDTTA